MSNLFPELIDQEEIVKAPALTHTRDYVPDKFLCGAPRDPSVPTTWSNKKDCVVCVDLWGGMSDLERASLSTYWAARG